MGLAMGLQGYIWDGFPANGASPLGKNFSIISCGKLFKFERTDLAVQKKLQSKLLSLYI